MIEEEKKERLIKRAKDARKNAYAPYSGFKVGAALLTSDGSIYTGCNIENASYGLTNCAERTAVFKAVSEGEREFETIALVGDSEGPTTPCGACRQVLLEFSDDMEVIMSDLGGDTMVKGLDELMKYPFKLKKNKDKKEE